MSRFCKHGVDCLNFECSRCSDEIIRRLGKKKLPHAERMDGTSISKPKPSLDDYDKGEQK